MANPKPGPSGPVTVDNESLGVATTGTRHFAANQGEKDINLSPNDVKIPHLNWVSSRNAYKSTRSTDKSVIAGHNILLIDTFLGIPFKPNQSSDEHAGTKGGVENGGGYLYAAKVISASSTLYVEGRRCARNTDATEQNIKRGPNSFGKLEGKDIVGSPEDLAAIRRRQCAIKVLRATVKGGEKERSFEWKKGARGQEPKVQLLEGRTVVIEAKRWDAGGEREPAVCDPKYRPHALTKFTAHRDPEAVGLRAWRTMALGAKDLAGGFQENQDDLTLGPEWTGGRSKLPTAQSVATGDGVSDERAKGVRSYGSDSKPQDTMSPTKAVAATVVGLSMLRSYFLGDRVTITVNAASCSSDMSLPLEIFPPTKMEFHFASGVTFDTLNSGAKRGAASVAEKAKQGIDKLADKFGLLRRGMTMAQHVGSVLGGRFDVDFFDGGELAVELEYVENEDWRVTPVWSFHARFEELFALKLAKPFKIDLGTPFPVVKGLKWFLELILGRDVGLFIVFGGFIKFKCDFALSQDKTGAWSNLALTGTALVQLSIGLELSGGFASIAGNFVIELSYEVVGAEKNDEGFAYAKVKGGRLQVRFEVVAKAELDGYRDGQVLWAPDPFVDEPFATGSESTMEVWKGAKPTH